MIFCLLFPLLAAAVGWLLALLMLRLFLSRDIQSEYTLKSQIRIHKPGLAQAAGAYAEAKMNPARLMERSGPILLQTLKPELESKITLFVEQQLTKKWPMLGLFLNTETLEKIKAGLMEELEAMLPDMLQKLTGTLAANIHLSELVEQKIMALSEMKILDYIKERHSKMISGIQWAGLLIGFIIGLVAILCFKIFLT